VRSAPFRKDQKTKEWEKPSHHARNAKGDNTAERAVHTEKRHFRRSDTLLHLLSRISLKPVTTFRKSTYAPLRERDIKEVATVQGAIRPESRIRHELSREMAAWKTLAYAGVPESRRTASRRRTINKNGEGDVDCGCVWLVGSGLMAAGRAAVPWIQDGRT
jgi:hypothetical protein